MNVKALDLNLLRVFDAVMAEGNVTRASQRLFLSQPATSHALGRLRHLLKDDLFVKVPGGVRPTPRALELAEPVHAALATLEQALNPPEFEPATSNRVIRLATHDYFTTLLMGDVASFLAEHAPRISLRLHPTAGRALEMLDLQEVDMAVSAFGELPERFSRAELFRDRYVCLVKRGHALTQGEFSVERFAAARHLLVSPRGDERGFVDTELAGRGLTRQVAMIINQFAPAGRLVAGSDLVLTASERLARLLTAEHDLVELPYPLDTPSAFSSSEVIWHRRLGAHPALAWFREVLVTLATE